MTGAVDSWHSAENARRYAEFARTHTTYQQTSRDVVGLARPAADATIVDLACGTGITTEAVLSVLGENGRIIAVDASNAMLAAAQSVIQDQRVRWLHSPAERLNDGTLAGVDAVVCNSAIWQADVQATAAAVRRVLRRLANRRSWSHVSCGLGVWPGQLNAMLSTLTWPDGLAAVPHMFREPRRRAASSGVWLHILEGEDLA
jgi:SAM-dependent methyltransferase